jgi:hypothetical protein
MATQSRLRAAEEEPGQAVAVGLHSVDTGGPLYIQSGINADERGHFENLQRVEQGQVKQGLNQI